MNRVTEAVARYERVLAERLASGEADEASLEETASLSASEWAQLGSLASESMLMGKLSTDEAQSMHALHTQFNNGASLAQRLAFMALSSELLAAKLGKV